MVIAMLGVILFCILFTLFCLLTRFPTLQMASPWWVKIVTETPQCTYYFGPFNNAREAKQAEPGYVEDLEQEGAKGIAVFISQYQPETLTICKEEG